jgi:hypothetical protein
MKKKMKSCLIMSILNENNNSNVKRKYYYECENVVMCINNNEIMKENDNVRKKK